MSRHARHSLRLTPTLLLPYLLFAVAVAPGCAASPQFSTVAISHTENSTLVCALVVAQQGGDDGGSGGGAKLRCRSLPGGEVMTYPSADVPYNAIAAGTDFLCGLMAPAGGHAAMRWWSFSEEAAANRSRPVGRRLYWGPSLRAMSAGGPHVCGLSDAHDPTCWEWPQLKLPKGRDFSRIALGDTFLCGVDKGTNSTMACFGGMTAPPPPNDTVVKLAAGRHHACSLDAAGELLCWGDGLPSVKPGELPADASALALGHNTTCVLAGDSTVRCWGVEVPEQYARTAFVAVEADGDTVCGVMLTNFSVVCWGSDHFRGRHLVFNETMPGACAPRQSCQCDVIPGSGTLCGSGGGEGGVELAVCQPCKEQLTSVRIVVPNGMNKTAASSAGDGGGGRKKKELEVALSVAGVGAAVLAAVGLAFYLVAFKKLDRKVHVSVRLGESSTRGLCRDVEGAIMPAPPPASPPPPSARPIGCEEFTLKELSRLTDGFAEEKKIGSGSFGSVYRAKLADGREVAIKRAERASSGGRRRRRYDAERAFRAELRLLSRVNHLNLVQLWGFCEERGERILVFEFMPYGALHDHLHGGDVAGAGSPLFASWEARLRVALDAARGVEYLHCYAVPPIIHRDVKPSNILLDGNWTAKVSDFGLSLASGSAAAAAAASSTSATAGTVGYIDPEYYRLQELTERSDVYSFGVVLLELVTGRKAIHRSSLDGSGSPRNVIEFAVPAVEAGNVGMVLDERVPPPRGHEAEAVARVAKIAAECVRPRGRARPVMSEVVAELEWAVTLCEESVIRTAGGAAGHHGGSDMSQSRSRSRSRSESDDPSPFGFGFGFGSGRVGHARSYSTM